MISIYAFSTQKGIVYFIDILYVGPVGMQLKIAMAAQTCSEKSRSKKR